MQQPTTERPNFTEEHRAPVVFFDGVPTYQQGNGVAGLTLAVLLALPNSEGGGVVATHQIVAHLRTTIPGATALRDALNKVLLSAAPTVGQAS